MNSIFGFFVFLWLALSGAVALWANRRGRSGFGFFLFGLFASPLVAAAYLGALRDKGAVALQAAASVPKTTSHVRCPACREFVWADATKCPHCHTELTP